MDMLGAGISTSIASSPDLMNGSCSSYADFEVRVLAKLKAYVQKLVTSLATKEDLQENIPDSSKALSKTVQDHVREAVRKLLSVNSNGNLEHCGTIVFVKEDIAITCFHEVHDKGQIMESNLCVDKKPLVHIVSFPFYDLSVYKCPGRKGSFLELGSYIHEAANVCLVSHPSLSNSSVESDSGAVICYGKVSQMEDLTALGDYQCFPGSSGGAIVSPTGKLLGMHLENVYHQNETCLQPPDWEYACLPNEAVRGLQWDKGATDAGLDTESFWENADAKALAKFAAQNVSSKGHLGRFQPIQHIRIKLEEEQIIPCRKRQRNMSCQHPRMQMPKHEEAAKNADPKTLVI